MKIEDMLDIFDIDEIEKMSPEECKGLLKGFFIGAGFIEAFRESVDELIDKRYKEKKTRPGYKYAPYASKPQDRQDFRCIKIEFQYREDAQAVLDDLRDTLEASEHNYVPVQDLYYLACLPTNSEMLNWVWYDLEDCEITREADHYILKMPPAELKNPYRG